MHLEPATPADLPAIADLMNRAYRGRGDQQSWNSEHGLIKGDRTTPAYLAQDLAAHPDATLLVARTPTGELQACVWLEPSVANTWYLGSFAADPRLQNAGLGRQLLAAAEHWARDRGAIAIKMHVISARDTLIAWYQRRGYQLTGESLPFPYGDIRFGTPIRDGLTFVTLRKTLAP